MKLRAGRPENPTYREIYRDNSIRLALWDYDSIHHTDDQIRTHCVISTPNLINGSQFLPTVPKQSTQGRCILSFIKVQLPLCPLLLALLNDSYHRTITLEALQ